MVDFRRIESVLERYARTEKFALDRHAKSGDVLAYLPPDPKGHEINITELAKELAEELA